MPSLLRGNVYTPVGTLHLAVDEHGALHELRLPNRTHPAAGDCDARGARDGFDDAARQLDEYFAGKRRVFELALRPAGSAFERDVWERLLQIPYGTTVSYGAIALEMGLVNGARAVGKANGANPIAIVIPCHRVIGGDGSLVGYGGGLPLKRKLLELEGMPAPLDLFSAVRSS